MVIAAGGHGRLGTKRGDYVVAFALLPESEEFSMEPRATPTVTDLQLPCNPHPFLLAASAVCSAGACTVAFAPRNGVEEVIVTATRTEQQLRDFAGSISRGVAATTSRSSARRITPRS